MSGYRTASDDLRTVIVLAKRPVPGRVKTRLCPQVSPAVAADLAAVALRDTLAAVSATPAAHRVLSFDGDPQGWIRDGWIHHPQPPGGLDVRIAAALGAAPSHALLVGMDTPQLDPDLLSAFDTARFDACLGPSTDGGYWALGLRDVGRAAEVVPGVPMSCTTTFDVQLRRLRDAGLRVQVLPELTDVDSMADAYAVAAAAPGTEFARTMAGVRVQDIA